MHYPIINSAHISLFLVASLAFQATLGALFGNACKLDMYTSQQIFPSAGCIAIISS